METNKKKSYIVTLLLAFCLGPLGIHRFYTGYILIGIIQLLTCGGFGLWVLIDNISLVLNKYKDANNNELDGHNVGCAMIVGFTIIISFVLAGFKALLSMFST